jgi:cellulose synthase/poly-beta-1,6-N-acetylglucosamine synthase-like glycosyltransferase
MKQIEIPYAEERGARYRFFEMLPGILSWTVLALPFGLSFIDPRLTAFVIITYLLLWFIKSIGLQIRAVQGFRRMHQHMKLSWDDLLADLQSPGENVSLLDPPDWHIENLARRSNQTYPVNPSDLLHAVIIAAYNEAREVLEPTIKSVLAAKTDAKNMILVIAYEGRDGAKSEKPATELVKEYGHLFRHAMAVKHPLNEREVRGKGGNITFAARKLQEYLQQKQIDPKNVIVTTLDSDNRPHPHYFNCVSYLFSVAPDPIKVSYQPIPMFTNNIWDAPAPMRVIATGNSFWMVVQSLRTHMLRNFSAHAQSMQALIDTDFWSVRTIVEDGHQFWRTYFRYDGQHEVYPVLLPIYQDAVLSSSYRKTLKAQFIQLRRWAWGASDVAYVAEKGFFTKNNVPKIDALMKFFRLLEGHVSWATAPLILAFSAFVPLILDPSDFTAHQLPIIASRIQTVAMAGIFITLFFSIKTLPPKPARYKAHRRVFMIIQWVYLPVTTIIYSAFSAINSQTRLIFGRYLDKFDVTDKAVITEDNKRVM